MKNNTRYKNIISEKSAVLVVRVPQNIRRKLKIIAACENNSMNEKILKYILNGLKKEESTLETL